MTFPQYWAILIKQWKLIVTCFIVMGLGAFIGSKLMTPIYQSSALIQVAVQSVNSPSAYTGLLASDQLVQTESQLATSDPVLQEVASHYPGLEVEQLAKQVSSTVKLNTQLFEIDVQDTDPIRAAQLANDVADTLIRQQLQLTQQDNSRAQQQLQQDLVNTEKQISDTSNKIATLQAQPIKKQAQIAILQSQLSGLEVHYNQWQTALSQLEETQAQNENYLRVIQPARPGIKPVQPNTLLNTGAGLGGGLLLGILLAIAYAQLDTRIHTSEELSQLLGVPVLAKVWRVASRKEEVVNPTGQNANSEAYRILRTNIGFSSIDKPLRLLIVTSAMPHEGKSTISANLAIFMAKAGRNTLLIDADLHRPTQHKFFDISTEKMGLSNAILACAMAGSAQPSGLQQPTSGSDTISLSPYIHTVGIPHLWVMPSGPLPPNPSELLDSKSMQCFLRTIQTAGIEMVIFDVPPLLGLSDVSILAPKVDGVLLVSDMSRAKKSNATQAKAILAQVGAHVLGCVMNKQRRSREDDAYSYYYYRTIEKANDENRKEKKKKKEKIAVPLTPLVAESADNSADLVERDTITTPVIPALHSGNHAMSKNPIPLTSIPPGPPDPSDQQMQSN